MDELKKELDHQKKIIDSVLTTGEEKRSAIQYMYHIADDALSWNDVQHRRSIATAVALSVIIIIELVTIIKLMP